MTLAAVLLLALVLAGITYQWIGTSRDARRFPPPGRLVDVGGGRLHVQIAAPKPGAAYGRPGAADVPGPSKPEGPDVPTVVFDAGISASSLSWLNVAPRVAEFARAVSYDRSGLAWSERTHAPVSARSLAGELRVLLRAGSVPPPYVLVGHSFGTFVARAFASDFSDDVAGVVLVDPIFPAEWLNMSRTERHRLRGGIFLSRVGAGLASIGFVRLCLDLLARGSTTVPRGASRLFGSEAAGLLRRLVRQVQKLPQAAWPMMRAHWSRPRSFLAMADHLGSLRRSAVEIAASKPIGDIPLVVLTAGSQPPPVREEHARIAAQSSCGTHIIAEQAGHWILIDEPDVVVDAVRRVVEARGR
jgi:pimeloyl-ACP methyl ester carboxylesterase